MGRWGRVRSGVLLLCLLVPALAWAQPLSAQVDSLRENYQPNRIRTEGQSGERRLWWVKSPLRERGSELQPDRAERVAITGSHWQVIEFDRAFNEADLFNEVLDGWSRQGYQEVFQCHGVSCGNSQHWANAVFGESLLYGIDRYQHYSTGRLNDRIRVLYTVRRGTQLNYVYWMEAELGMSTSELANRLGAGEAIAVNAYPLPSWAAVLQEHPDWTLVLVGHARTPGLDAARAQGQEQAERRRQDWIENGMPAARVRAQSVGYLSGGQPRVTVVRVPDATGGSGS